MRLNVRIADLHLRHTFTIARGSSDVVRVIVVELSHDGIIGYGECSPSLYHGQSPETVISDLESLSDWLASRDPVDYRLLLDEAALRLGNNLQALCALDLALHDWIGKRHSLPLWKLWGLSDKCIPPTCYTLGLDAVPKMIEKLHEFSRFPIFKIKLGRDGDMEIVRAIRRETSAILRVDANTGWTPEETIEKSHELKSLDVEYIEQPLPPDRNDEMEEVRAKSALPIIADESSVRPEDIPNLRGRFDGINIKLVKCGGLQPALRMIALARTYGMKVMIGCMIESSCCCTAAAHLGSLADYLDLDGPLLIAQDPFRGMTILDGAIHLPSTPGLGVEPV